MKDILGISVSTGNWQLLPDYAKAGIQVVEISLPNKPIDDNRLLAAQAYALLRQSGMTLWSVHIPFGRNLDISCTNEAERLAVLDALRPTIDLARGLGAQVLVIHGSSEPNEDSTRPARMQACAQSLAALQQYAGSMRLAVENLPRTCIGRVGWEMAELSQHCAGVCFDVNHLLMEDHDAFMAAAKHRVITTHLSDYDGIDERHWLPGKGMVPWKKVHDTLLDAGYDGPFLFELGSSPEGTPWPAEQVVEAWRNALDA